MNIIDFLWLLPGFIFVQVIKQANNQDRVQSETRYILTLLFASAVVGLFALLVVVAVNLSGLIDSKLDLRSYWHHFLPAPYTATLCLAIAIAYILGKAISIFLSTYPGRFKRSNRRFMSRFRIKLLRFLDAIYFISLMDWIYNLVKRGFAWFYPERKDTYFRTIISLLGNTAYLTTTKGRIYIAVVIGADIDPNETKQFIRIVPLVSGAKESEGVVKFTTLYRENIDALDAGQQDLISITMEFSNIETIGVFSKALHKRLVEEGKIKFAWESGADN